MPPPNTVAPIGMRGPVRVIVTMSKLTMSSLDSFMTWSVRLSGE